MSPPSSIRPVTREDLRALKGLIDDTQLFPSELLDDMIYGFLSGEAKDEFWITCDDDGPVAVAYYAPERMTSGTWNLLLIAVHPERQGRGIGTALTEHIERKLASRGQRILLVETSGLPEFERTRRFYRNNGFREEARIRDYYQAGEDKIVFWKSLQTGG